MRLAEHISWVSGPIVREFEKCPRLESTGDSHVIGRQFLEETSLLLMRVGQYLSLFGKMIGRAFLSGFLMKFPKIRTSGF